MGKFLMTLPVLNSISLSADLPLRPTLSKRRLS